MRILIGAVGVLLLIGGLAAAYLGGPGGFVVALWLFGSGALLVVVAIIEVNRYRSEHAELTGADPGPGGGESSALEQRFRPTEEVFVDPTTRVRMRVYADSATGERRYVADG